jgi:large subunit ribosomal protein L18
MNRLEHKKITHQRRSHRVRAVIASTASLPRLSVSISNRHVLAQVVDDANRKTLVYVSSVGKKAEGTMTEKAQWVGEQLATKARKAKVTKVVFDRGGRKYHGRVKALADAARAGGMEF